MNKEGCCVENAWFLNNSHKSSNGSGDEVTSEKNNKIISLLKTKTS